MSGINGIFIWFRLNSHKWVCICSHSFTWELKLLYSIGKSGTKSESILTSWVIASEVSKWNFQLSGSIYTRNQTMIWKIGILSVFRGSRFIKFFCRDWNIRLKSFIHIWFNSALQCGRWFWSYTENINTFIVIMNLYIYLFRKTVGMAALAQLGERQTEDLKAPCSIHGGGISFSLRQLLVFHKLWNIMIWFLPNTFLWGNCVIFIGPIESKRSMGIILSQPGRLHFNAYICKLRREC